MKTELLQYFDEDCLLPEHGGTSNFQLTPVDADSEDDEERLYGRSSEQWITNNTNIKKKKKQKNQNSSPVHNTLFLLNQVSKGLGLAQEAWFKKKTATYWLCWFCS